MCKDSNDKQGFVELASYLLILQVEETLIAGQMKVLDNMLVTMRFEGLGLFIFHRIGYEYGIIS